MDINVDLLQWSIIFFDKKTSGGTVKNGNIIFLLFVIHVFRKHARVISLKDRISTNAFQKMLNESNPKQNKIWLGKGSE